ncbi:MAG: cyclic nucleotide-binding domain-containing protein [Hyphomicrobiales bacterium]|nr:MAG: cyclic nucleotide-binding domain-containing protein [Hyphomicrobiales bacterium]
MASILALTKSQPVRSLAPGERLIEEGAAGGDLYVLQAGRLIVSRDGIDIATIIDPGALVGEMGVLLATDHSATVRADVQSEVRVIDNAIAFLERTPLVALHVATIACERLDRTSALLVEMRKEAGVRPEELGFIGRLFAAISEPSKRSGPVTTHE